MKIVNAKIKCFYTILFLFLCTFLNAQNNSFVIDFKWNGTENEIIHGDTINRLSFEGAYYENDEDPLKPLYKTLIPVYAENVEADFNVRIIASEMVSKEELALVSDVIEDTPVHNYKHLISRDDCKLCFTLSPFFMNNDTIMRVLSCEVNYSLKETRSESKKSFADNSVLSSGKWYKMSLASTGMYKISYSDLESMGISVSSVDPRNIRIYHNGGGVLPVVNKHERHDDLYELPIYVHGEDDGVFNSGDYIVFYGRGPVTWECKGETYERVINPYSDYSYAFLTTDLGAGKRIQDAESITDESDETIASFIDYRLVEDDVYNLNNMGATWYFDKFDVTTTRSYSFNFPNLIKDKHCILKVETASRNTASPASFRIKANGTQISYLSFNTLTNTSKYALEGKTGNVKFNSSSSGITVDLEYERSSTSSVAWLDFIMINAWRELKFTGNVMSFRNPDCVDDNKCYTYKLSNASNKMQVWDVTNPVEPRRLQLDFSSDIASFKVKGSSDNEFIAFNGNEYKSIGSVSTVQNQNLHSNYDFDYLIITYPDFYSQAERLKELHSHIDDLKIEIVTPNLIYNEFSCGALDVTAIRDYIKMIYDKSDKRLRYVLLLGDASYDFRNKSGQVCFIPSWQSVHSVSTYANVTDDFFACLDANEGDMNIQGSIVDVAVGRMPVNSLEEAKIAINKIEAYLSKDEESMGPWRKLITFIADDQSSTYMNHAEQLENIVKEQHGDNSIINKIYLDAYPQVATSSGERSPECNAAITNRMEQGSLIINYIGHAGEVGWADERILTNDDIHALRNSPKLHLMITASCEFSRFDDHTRTSAGEYVFLNENGGAIAMVSAARVTYASNNQNLFKGFYEHLFDVEGGDFITMGDMYVYGKQINDDNSKDYAFFGDPALRLNYPKNNIEITSINNHDVDVIDTIRALERTNIKGVVKDVYGNIMSDFNGIIHIDFYDKESVFNTYGNQTEVFTYRLRNSIIYSGKSQIVNGEFNVEFILPKDINYSYGKGLISLYAYSDSVDAQGSFSNIIVGGMNQNADIDNAGPEIKIYIDDEKFVDGSMTNENPLLIAYIKDANGITTSGAGIGHDITATLSGATNKTYTLNQFYESPLSIDDYGYLTYKLYGLNEGEHLLTFRAWDIYNNSNTVTISFNVVNGEMINIENLVAYPNPMSDYTNVTFEHNQKDNEIDVVIRIYDMMGQLVRTINEHRYGTTARIEPIYWDLTSDNGSKLPAGMYVYNVTITNSLNEQTSEYSKLIIR